MNNQHINSSNENFFLLLNQERKGPYSWQDILLQLKSNTISIQTLCHDESTTDWIPIADLLIKKDTEQRVAQSKKPGRTPKKSEYSNSKKSGNSSEACSNKNPTSTKPENGPITSRTCSRKSRHPIVKFLLPVGYIGRGAFALRIFFIDPLLSVLTFILMLLAVRVFETCFHVSLNDLLEKALIQFFFSHQIAPDFISIILYAIQGISLLLCCMYFMFVSGAKRAHDLNKPTYYALWLLVPLVQWGFLLMFLSKPSRALYFRDDE